MWGVFAMILSFYGRRIIRWSLSDCAAVWMYVIQNLMLVSNENLTWIVAGDSIESHTEMTAHSSREKGLFWLSRKVKAKSDWLQWSCELPQRESVCVWVAIDILSRSPVTHPHAECSAFGIKREMRKCIEEVMWSHLLQFLDESEKWHEFQMAKSAKRDGGIAVKCRVMHKTCFCA